MQNVDDMILALQMCSAPGDCPLDCPYNGLEPVDGRTCRAQLCLDAARALESGREKTPISMLTDAALKLNMTAEYWRGYADALKWSISRFDDTTGDEEATADD